MPSVYESIQSISDTRDTLSSTSNGLESISAGLYGADGPGTADESFVIFGADTSDVVLVGLETVALGFQRLSSHYIDLLETRIDLRGAIDVWSRSIDSALSASSSGERIARIAEVLPGLGTTFRRANIDQLLGEAADISREFQREIDRIDTAYTESLDSWRRINSLAEDAAFAIPIVGAVVTAGQYVVHGVQTRDWSPRLLPASVEATNVDPGDVRLENAFAAAAGRHHAVTAPATEVTELMQDAMQTMWDNIEAVIEQLSGLQGMFDEIEDLFDQIGELPDAIAPFTQVLGAMTAPFDAIFDFLADPPQVFGVRIFPAISRSDIDDVVDFLAGISDFIFGFLDPILDPLLDPVTEAVNDVFDALNPIRDFVGPMDRLDELMDEILEAMSGLDGMFDPLLALQDNLPDLPDFVEEIETPDASETRATYFGTDEGETVFGRGADVDDGMGLDGAVLNGNGGDDRLIGTALDDFLLGGLGNDFLQGRGGTDVLFGQGDDDRLIGGAGNDVLSGNGGDDQIKGGSGDDDITGNTGADRIRAGEGNDRVDGGANDDRIWDGAGNDRITGNSGDDRMFAGAGLDTFVFAASGDGIDRIRNFEQGEDLIEIDGHRFRDVDITQRESRAIIEYGDGDVIRLVGFEGTLTSDDFI